MLSNAAQKLAAEHSVGKANWPGLTGYLAICTAAPSASSTGSSCNETTYTGYARKITAASDWNAYSAGVITNATQLNFPQCTAGANQLGKYLAIIDASSAGTLIHYFPIAPSGATLKDVTSITRSGTTATVTCTGHGLSVNDLVDHSGATDSLYNGDFTVATVIDANTYTVTLAGTPSANAVADVAALRAIKIQPITIAPASTPQVAAGAIAFNVR